MDVDRIPPEERQYFQREQLVRRVCVVMGWEYHTSPVWAGLRKVALAEAVAIGLDKLEEIIIRLEELERCPPHRPQWEEMARLKEEEH
jgi:hypothetical protein